MAIFDTSGITRSSEGHDETADSPLAPMLSAPALPVTLAFAAGIMSDRVTNAGLFVWMGTAALALVVSRGVDRRGFDRTATLLLLTACLCLGGLRHGVRWSAMSAADVSRHTSQEPVPVQLVGVIASPVTIRAADRSEMAAPWQQVDRSQCDLQCESLVGLGTRTPVTGRLRMTTAGHLLHANVGDRVEVTGQLLEPRGLQNPGGFDYRAYLRRSGIRCMLDVDHPEAVRLLAPQVSGRLARFRARLRDECESVFVQHLDRESVPLAMSLLLGERSSLPHDVRDAFAESGTTHLLAISGLHVGILAALLLLLCRLLKTSVPMTAVVLIVGVVAYAFVTNHRPPVMRASILVVTAAAGWPWFRRAGGVNLIALCALVVLLINPTDLFEIGAQLSFLAVGAIGWAASVVARWRHDPWRSSWSEWLFDPHPGLAQYVLRLLAEGFVMTAAIWFVTLPLIAARFHIVAPVGFLLNVLLLPFVGVVLWLGFLTLFAGLLAPWVVRWPAMVFDGSLRTLQWVVDGAAHVKLGHAFVVGPPEWWLAGFYSLLAAAMLIRRRHVLRRWALRGVGGWVIAGLLLPLLPSQRDGLRCTFLSVGHGCAVVIELPSGETLLYDAGMFGNARYGQAIIQQALWERGIRGIDAIIVSHADVDHFNAAAGLLRTMPVGTLFCNQTFLDFGQEPVAALCETASREAVPIRLLQSSDRLNIGNGDVELTVLHPPPRWSSERDNANSLVLRIRYAGRTLLLTGDLEREGLDELLRQQTGPVDVMLSPHHGSLAANPPALNDWATPRYVVISGGEGKSDAELRMIYTQATQVLSTRIAGAVTAHVSSSGELTIFEWIGQKTER